MVRARSAATTPPGCRTLQSITARHHKHQLLHGVAYARLRPSSGLDFCIDEHSVTHVTEVCSDRRGSFIRRNRTPPKSWCLFLKKYPWMSSYVHGQSLRSNISEARQHSLCHISTVEDANADFMVRLRCWACARYMGPGAVSTRTLSTRQI